MAWLVWSASAPCWIAMLYTAGIVRIGVARSGSGQYGTAGSEGLCSARSSSARIGAAGKAGFARRVGAWLGRHGMAGVVWPVWVWSRGVWQRTAELRGAWQARRVSGWHGQVWRGMAGTEWIGVDRHGALGRGTAGKGMLGCDRCDYAWSGTTRPSRASQAPRRCFGASAEEIPHTPLQTSPRLC